MSKCETFTLTFFCIVLHHFTLILFCINTYVVSFSRLEKINEIKERLKNKIYLFLHVHSKLFEFHAHVQLLGNINFCLQFKILLSKLHTQFDARVRTSNSNQYSWPWLITHVVTIGEKKSHIPITIGQVFVKGILLAKVSI